MLLREILKEDEEFTAFIGSDSDNLLPPTTRVISKDPPKKIVDSSNLQKAKRIKNMMRLKAKAANPKDSNDPVGWLGAGRTSKI